MTLYKFTESVLSLKKLEVQPMFGLLIRDGVFYFLGCVGKKNTQFMAFFNLND